jgi:hypothetical protein
LRHQKAPGELGGDGAGFVRSQPICKLLVAPIGAISSPSLQFNHVVSGRESLDEGEHVISPGVQGRALLQGKIAALINPHDAGAASRDLVEDLLRHFEANPEPL